MNSTNLIEASVQWRNRPADQRFQTLSDLRASVHSRRLRSRSVDIDRNDVHAEPDGENGLLINSKIAPCTPTHWAFGQLCSASIVNGVTTPAKYLRQLPAPLAVQCLNQGLRSGDRQAHKFMTIESSDPCAPNVLQAVTSTTYGRIWDADVVDAIDQVVQRSGGRFVNPPAYRITQDGGIDTSTIERAGLYASDHDVFAFMIDGGSMLETGSRAQLHRGFFAWNSETMAKTFGLMTFMFNKCCGNNIVWGATDINKLIIRHVSSGPQRFASEAAPALKAYIEAGDAPFRATIEKAQSMIVWDGQDSDALLNYLAKSGSKFSRSEVMEALRFAKSEEGDCRTLWQLVQGFTAYARGYDYIDSRVDLESRAGKLLNLAA